MTDAKLEDLINKEVALAQAADLSGQKAKDAIGPVDGAAAMTPIASASPEPSRAPAKRPLREAQESERKEHATGTMPGPSKPRNMPTHEMRIQVQPERAKANGAMALTDSERKARRAKTQRIPGRGQMANWVGDGADPTLPRTVGGKTARVPTVDASPAFAEQTANDPAPTPTPPASRGQTVGGRTAKVPVIDPRLYSGLPPQVIEANHPVASARASTEPKARTWLPIIVIASICAVVPIVVLLVRGQPTEREATPSVRPVPNEPSRTLLEGESQPKRPTDKAATSPPIGASAASAVAAPTGDTSASAPPTPTASVKPPPTSQPPTTPTHKSIF